MAAVPANPQIAGNSLNFLRIKPCASGMAPLSSSHLQKERICPHLMLCSEGIVMENWFVSLVPASVAVAIIGYSFWIYYA